MNNVFLVISAFMVLLGTLFPLVLEAFGYGKISVGAPYFDFMFVVLTLPLAILVGIGAMSRWKRDDIKRFKSPAFKMIIFSVISALVLTFLMSQRTETNFSLGAASGAFLSIWIAAWSIYGWYERSQNKVGIEKLKQPASFIGMTIAHMGIAVFILGVTHVNTYSIEKNVSLSVGDNFQLRDYNVEFKGIERKSIENYIANQGDFIITRSEKVVTRLYPQKRYYTSDANPLTEASIDTNLGRDLYISLGEPAANDPQTWSVRLYYKSFVVWIWLGGFIMAFGGIIAMFDRRFRKVRAKDESSKEDSVPSTSHKEMTELAS